MPTQTVAEHLGAKYGGERPAADDRPRSRPSRPRRLVYRLGEAQRANTVDAHRLLHLAHEEGRQDALKEALLAAYFLHARNVADHDVLAGVAAEVGLDEVRVKEVLTSGEYADAVEADVRQAVAYGATSVPFFVVDQKYGVAGAQPADVLARCSSARRAESRPSTSSAARTRAAPRRLRDLSLEPQASGRTSTTVSAYVRPLRP